MNCVVKRVGKRVRMNWDRKWVGMNWVGKWVGLGWDEFVWEMGFVGLGNVLGWHGMNCVGKWVGKGWDELGWYEMVWVGMG